MWLAAAEGGTQDAEPNASSTKPAGAQLDADELHELRKLVTTMHQTVSTKVMQHKQDSFMSDIRDSEDEGPAGLSPIGQATIDLQLVASQLEQLFRCMEAQMQAQDGDSPAPGHTPMNDGDMLHPSTAELDMEGHCMEAGGHCLVGVTIMCQRIRVMCAQSKEDLQRRITMLQGGEVPEPRNTSAYSTVPRTDEPVEEETEEMAML